MFLREAFPRGSAISLHPLLDPSLTAPVQRLAVGETTGDDPSPGGLIAKHAGAISGRPQGRGPISLAMFSLGPR